MSIGPTFSAKALTALVESTSSLRFLAFGMPSSSATSLSVAQTVAPSATKASAMARPIPCPAAVTTATLPFKRPAMLGSFLAGFCKGLAHMGQPPVGHVLMMRDGETQALIPADALGELGVGVEMHGAVAQRLRPL